MECFTSKTPIESCFVTKELIQSLEEYLKNSFYHLYKEEDYKKIFNENLSILIIDSHGTEKLPSISAFSLPRFSDSTTSVSIKLDTIFSSPPKLKVYIDFKPDRFFAKVHIEKHGDDAREFVTGLNKRIHEIIATKHTINWIFNPTFYFGLFSVSISSILAMLIFIYIRQAQIPYALISITVPICLYTFITKKIRHYITFDSNLEERRSKIWNWFVGALGTFVIFTMFFPKISELIKNHIP
jgi:hypothetical protein